MWQTIMGWEWINYQVLVSPPLKRLFKGYSDGQMSLFKSPTRCIEPFPPKMDDFWGNFQQGRRHFWTINFHCRCSYILRLYLTSQVPQTYLLLEVTLKLIVFEWDCNVERQNPIYDMNLYLYLNLNSNLHLNLYLYLYLYLYWIFICICILFVFVSVSVFVYLQVKGDNMK